MLPKYVGVKLFRWTENEKSEFFDRRFFCDFSLLQTKIKMCCTFSASK